MNDPESHINICGIGEIGGSLVEGVQRIKTFTGMVYYQLCAINTLFYQGCAYYF